MRTSNPALNSGTFEGLYTVGDQQAMTLGGTALKTTMLLVMTTVAAGFSWSQLVMGSPLAMPVMFGGAIVGCVVGLITCFKPKAAPITAPIYALAEGLFLGGLSAMYNAQFHGIVFQAVCLTFGTMFALLLAYQTGMIKPSENFKLGIFAATAGIGLVYLTSVLMNLFGMSVPYIHDNGLVGIGFSLFVVVIAALNLVLDFDFIETGVEQGAPKYMEWYAAYGLLVTLVWLYVEILRLLAKLRSRD